MDGEWGTINKVYQTSQQIFQLVTQKNILLELFYVPSKRNPADSFSRSLSKSDSMLSKYCWDMVGAEFGGLPGHNLKIPDGVRWTPIPKVIFKDLRCLISRLTLHLDLQELTFLMKIRGVATESRLTPMLFPPFV